MSKEPIKVNVTRTVTEEIQIKFPFYAKTDATLYLRFADNSHDPLTVVISEERKTYYVRTDMKISFDEIIRDMGEGSAVNITAKEFNEAYKRAMKHLRTEFNSIKAKKQQ